MKYYTIVLYYIKMKSPCQTLPQPQASNEIAVHNLAPQPQECTFSTSTGSLLQYKKITIQPSPTIVTTGSHWK